MGSRESAKTRNNLEFRIIKKLVLTCFHHWLRYIPIWESLYI